MKKILLIFLTCGLVPSGGWPGSTTEDYELQEKCASRAKERFREEFNIIYYDYQNHYNRKKNKCFMWVWLLGWIRVQYLYDANEKQYYGIIIIDDKGIRCQVLGNYCTSKTEWNAFIKPYIEE